MGLDATVYCNGFERGLLKEPPPSSSVFVSDDGSLDCRNEDLDSRLSFDEWVGHRTCEHPNGVLLHHRIGNLEQVGLLRSELERDGVKFPILLSKVLYSGTHAGDYLTLQDIATLAIELDRLSSFLCSTERNQEYVDWFRQQMVELVDAATRVKKPISF